MKNGSIGIDKVMAVWQIESCVTWPPLWLKFEFHIELIFQYAMIKLEFTVIKLHINYINSNY